MIVGDYVKVLGNEVENEGENEVEKEVEWYAEVVGVLDDTLEVYFIERGLNGVWNYSAEWHSIPRESVQEHVETKTIGVVKALQVLGFRPLDEGSFVKLDEEDELANVPIGMALPSDDDFIGIHPEMRDFIVPDEEGEPFSFAAPCKFVRETHEAVHGFNNWNPDDTGKKVKEFVDTMSTRVIVQENARTKLGCALTYDKPPLYK